MSDPLTTASSALGLAKSLIDFVPASGSLINLSRETYDWLIRERIDEGSFERCRQMALGLAYPNDAGMDIQRQINEADRKIAERVKQLPIRLVLSGSIGRLLAKNVDTCYMVSTVAALTKFHNPEFATDALCSMILDKGGHEKNVSLEYNVQRNPVKAVISKVVESIYVNVVNAGHDLGGLPAELKHLHPHLLSQRTFAGIVMGIERSEQDVVIRSGRFLSDLTLWLLLHFQGSIVVSVDKTVLFEKTLGPRPRVVRIMVRKLCPEVCDELPTPVETLVSVGDTLVTFLKGRGISKFPKSYTRQAFYDVENLINGIRSVRLSVLNQAECNSITIVARTIMGWLLNLPVVPYEPVDVLYDQNLTFRVLLGEGEESDMSVGDLLQNHPRLHSVETGSFPQSDSVLLHLHENWTDAFSDVVFSSVIFKRFPMAQSLLEQIRARCSCSACKSKAELNLCKRGCLREATTTRLCVLLAHGICDAFGAKDVSGRATSEDQVTGIIKLLSEILKDQLVRWDTWFELAACTTTGIPLDSFRSDDFGIGSSCWAAAQYGSLLAVTPWLDVAEKAKVKGCFGIITLEGNLQGVRDDVGLVCCEMAESNLKPGPPDECNRTEMDTAADDFNHNTLEEALQLDTLKVEIYTAVFHAGGCLYRHMTTVRSDRNVRIVDPSHVIMGLARSHCIQCKHDPASALNSSKDVIRADDFDRILAKWHWSNTTYAYTIHTSKVLDSQLKINVLLSILRKGSVLRDTKSCCCKCAIGKIQGLDDPRQNYIINTTAPSSALAKTRAGKRRTEL